MTASQLADTAEQHQRAAAVAQERCRLVEAARQEQAAQSAAREDKWRRAVSQHIDSHPHCSTEQLLLLVSLSASNAASFTESAVISIMGLFDAVSVQVRGLEARLEQLEQSILAEQAR